MPKKARTAEIESPAPCPGCERLEDELARSEQRSYERLREITALYSTVQEEREREETRRLAALDRLKALQKRLQLP